MPAAACSPLRSSAGLQWSPIGSGLLTLSHAVHAPYRFVAIKWRLRKKQACSIVRKLFANGERASSRGVLGDARLFGGRDNVVAGRFADQFSPAGRRVHERADLLGCPCRLRTSVRA